MKNPIQLSILLVTCALTNVCAQVGDWPANPAYTYFGATQLPQSNVGYYAVLQDKSTATTFINSADHIRFRIGNSDKFILTNSGNVGIGTTNPIARLGVSVPISTSNAGGNPNAYGAYFTDDLTSTMAIRSLGNGAFHIATDASGRKVILGGGTFEQTLFVNSGGKVGIGSTAGEASTVLSLGTPVQARMLTLHDNPSDWYGMGMAGGQMRFQVGSTSAKFSFFGGDNAEVLTVVGNGNLGIGTTSPQAKIDIAGNSSSYMGLI